MIYRKNVVANILLRQKVANLIFFALLGLSMADPQISVYGQNNYDRARKDNILEVRQNAPSFQQPTRVINWSINSISADRSNLSSSNNNIFLGKMNFRRVLDDPNEIEHWDVGSYYSVEDGLTATLMLNNKGITPLTVSPTLYRNSLINSILRWFNKSGMKTLFGKIESYDQKIR